MAAVLLQRRANEQANFESRVRRMSVTSWKSVKSITSWKSATSCLSKQKDEKSDADSDYGSGHNQSNSDGQKTRSNSGHSHKTRRDSVMSKTRRDSILSTRRRSRKESHTLRVTVSDVRVYLLNEMNKNRDKYYSSDFKRIETNDWFIQRHILDHEESGERAPTNITSFNASVVAVSKQILSMLAWKKESNIHDTSKFSSEFFTAGILTYGRDPLSGQLYAFIRGKCLHCNFHFHIFYRSLYPISGNFDFLWKFCNFSLKFINDLSFFLLPRWPP